MHPFSIWASFIWLSFLLFIFLFLIPGVHLLLVTPFLHTPPPPITRNDISPPFTCRYLALHTSFRLADLFPFTERRITEPRIIERRINFNSQFLFLYLFSFLFFISHFLSLYLPLFTPPPPKKKFKQRSVIRRSVIRRSLGVSFTLLIRNSCSFTFSLSYFLFHIF